MSAESQLNSDFKDILDHLPAGCQIIDFDWRYRYVNAIGAQQAREAPDKLLGQKITDVYPSLAATPTFQALTQCLTARTSAILTNEFVYPDNTTAWFELHVQPIPDGLLVMSVDMAERQRNDEALKKLTRALKLLSDCNQALVRVDDEQCLLAEICRLIVERGGYRMAWVGLAEQDQAKSVRPIAQVGFEDGYLDRAQITWADTERGRGPTGTAVRTGVVQINQNFLTNPAMAPWRDAARARGYQSSIALPLKDANSTFGVLNIYSALPDAFDADEAKLLTELANDLAYGLTALRARAAHRQAAQALQDSENRYRRITESLTDYQYSVRVENGRPVETTQSPTCLKVTGYTAEEFAADPYLWIRMVAPEDRELVLEHVQQILAGTETPPIEHRICRKDGEMRWVSDTIILFTDAAGNLLSYDGMITDITDRKRTEEALRASEQRFRLLFQNLTSGFALHEIILDEQGKPCDYRFLDINPAFEALTGLKAQDVIGKTVRQVLPDTEAVWIDRYGQVVLSGIPIHFENFSGALGKYYEVSAYCPEDGKFAVTFSDVTGRKHAEDALQESEERFRSLYENSTVGIYRTTPEGRILLANPALVKLLGYTSFDELATRNLEKEGFKQADGRAQFIEAIELAGEVKGLESAWIRRDGTVIFVRESARVIRDPNGKTLYYDGIVEDVTERKQAEDALRASEERFRALVENSGDIIALLTGEGLILYESPAVKRVLGYQPGEMVGHNGFEFLHPGDFAISQELFKKLLQPHHTPVTTELRYKRKDGTWAWVQATGTNLLAESSVQAIVINYQDITERKQATEALREVNETLQALFDYSPLAIIMLDLNGYVRLWNKAAERMYGWTTGEVVGRFLPTIPAGKVAEYQAILQRVIRGESITDMEVEHRRKDGSDIYIGLSVAPLRDAAGRIYAQMSIAVDITERKQRERELEVIALMATALRAAPSRGDMLPVIVDQTLAILQGKGAALVMDRPATDEAIVVLARGDWAAQTGQRTRRRQSLAGRVMLTGQSSVIHDVRTELPEAEVDAFQSVTAVAGVPLIEQVETIGALVIGRTTPITSGELRVLKAIADIAANALYRANIVETLEQRVIDRTQDLSAVNAQLAAANERLQELDRLKSKFVSEVSHELRTPITTLSLNVDLLEHGRPDKREQYLQAIRQQVKRQAQLLEDILNLSRLELGADKVRFAPVALNALIAQIVAVHQPAADAKNLTLTFTPDHELPVVPGEESQLAQVITNLIGNAINYTTTGGIEVSTSSSERAVVIGVRDAGSGIDPEDLPHVFERFYRGSRTRDTRGTGLGLAIVKEIVDLHDGRVEVESQIDVGTTFRVYLPLTARPPSARRKNGTTT